MLNLRRWTKYHLYGALGRFPYFGFRVYFPKGSIAFRRTCQEGVFEGHNVRILRQLCLPGSYMFDVGANLGLMALPLLATVADLRVVSFEPSPNALPWLKQTIARSGLGNRWQLVEKAVGSTEGVARFSVSGVAEGMFDGLTHTRRAKQVRSIQVNVTNLDEEWRRLGCPNVSVIKIDVEGGELDVLRGGCECLARTHAFVLTEWSSLNFGAYGISNSSLLEFARQHEYLLYALPEIIRVSTTQDLEMQILRTADFLMVPRRSGQIDASFQDRLHDRRWTSVTPAMRQINAICPSIRSVRIRE